MWKNFLFRSPLYKVLWKKNVTHLKVAHRSKYNLAALPKSFTKCFIFGSGFNLFKGHKQVEPMQPFSEEKLTEDMQNACHKNVEALVELMHTLNVCMMEINKEYTTNLVKQIEITRRCTELGPLSENWDELTKYRVQADDLKMEFNKYELLVQKVGQMVFYQAVTSLMSGNEKETDLLNYEYNRLEKMVENLIYKNKEVEMKLLTENRDSILYTKVRNSQDKASKAN